MSKQLEVSKTEGGLRVRPWAAGLLALLLVVPIGTGLGAHADETEEGRGGEVTIDFRGEALMIEEFLVQIADIFDINLIWDSTDKQIRGRQLSGSFSFTGPREEAMQKVRAVLTFQELVMVPVGGEDGAYVVMDARRTTAILKQKPEFVTITDENIGELEDLDGHYVTTTVRVENMHDLRNARNALTRLVTSQNIGNVTEVPDARVFVITDFAPNVAMAYRLLREMDKKSPATDPVTAQRVFKAVTLKHAQALSAAMTLRNLFPRVAEQPVMVSAGRNQAVPVQPPQRLSLSIQPDERTNQILVTGHAEEVQEVLDAIATLDVDVPQAPPARQMPLPPIETSIVGLRHRGAVDVGNLLDRMLAVSPGTWSGGVRPQLRIVVDSEAEQILVTGSAAEIEGVTKFIAQLDQPESDD